MEDLLKVLTPGSEEWALARQVDPARLPRHVAVIMDGNGRWARRRHLPRAAGHKAGVDSVRSIMETGARMGLEVLTLYAFSTENWKRPRAEVDTLFRLLRFTLRGELDNMMKAGIRLRAIGRLDELPDAAREELEQTIRATEGNQGLIVQLALNYSGRSELVDAVNRLMADGHKRVTEEKLASYLYTAAVPDPDLLIRTSGEMRVSNFLLWQIAYAELFVTETLWPDFRCVDLLRAVIDYQKRDRRFGGLSLVGAPVPVTEEAELSVGG
jgi:undecaprenyl diphosphate synthase